MARKTVKIERIRELANSALFHTADDNKQGREAIQMMTEVILQEAGQYNGFRYLTRTEMQDSFDGISFGINPSTDEGSNQFEGSDNTRVKYL